jgi:hypothetical protein
MTGLCHARGIAEPNGAHAGVAEIEQRWRDLITLMRPFAEYARNC